MYIISLVVTSFRIQNLIQIIRNIEQQTLIPEKVLVYYSVEPWHLDDGIKKIHPIETPLNIEFRCVPNMGSSRKYLFTLKEYYLKNTKILFIDDDRLWRPDVFEILYKKITDENLSLVTTSGWSSFSMIRNEMQQPILRTHTVHSHQITKNKEILIASSGWATMINSNAINPRIFDENLIKEYRVTESDEIYLSTMINASKYVVPISGNCYYNLNSKVNLWFNEKTTDAKLKQLQLFSKFKNIRWFDKNESFHPNSLLP